MSKSFQLLLLEARQGSSAALSELLVPYQASLEAYASKLLGRDLLKFMDDMDLTQDVFVVAASSLTKFRGQNEQDWLHWLRGICRNCFLNLLRDRAPKIRGTHSLQAIRQEGSAFDVQALQTSIFGRIEKRHEERLFERVLAWLPEEDRTLLVKKYLGEEEASWAELAAEFGMSEVALRRRGSRLIELLRGGMRLLEKIDHNNVPEPLAELLCLKFLQRLTIDEIAIKSGESSEKIRSFLQASEYFLKQEVAAD